jgi:hypothetical protein
MSFRPTVEGLEFRLCLDATTDAIASDGSAFVEDVPHPTMDAVADESLLVAYDLPPSFLPTDSNALDRQYRESRERMEYQAEMDRIASSVVIDPLDSPPYLSLEQIYRDYLNGLAEDGTWATEPVADPSPTLFYD